MCREGADAPNIRAQRCINALVKYADAATCAHTDVKTHTHTHTLTSCSFTEHTRLYANTADMKAMENLTRRTDHNP